VIGGRRGSPPRRVAI